MTRSLHQAAMRFAVAGLFNTAITGVALSLLAIVIDPRVAYAVVFVAGTWLATWLADRYVYGVDMSRHVKLTYAAMYAVVFLVGLAALVVAHAQGLPNSWSGAVVLVTAPTSFLLGRLITRGLPHTDPATTPPDTIKRYLA